MRNILLLALALFTSSCEDYYNWNLPIKDLGQGEICGELLSCSISSSTNNVLYFMEIDLGPYEIGDTITVNMLRGFGFPDPDFGQAKNVSLYCNEDLIYSFGDDLSFIENERKFTIPSWVNLGYCYTLRIFKESSSRPTDVWVSSKFAIK